MAGKKISPKWRKKSAKKTWRKKGVIKRDVGLGKVRGLKALISKGESVVSTKLVTLRGAPRYIAEQSYLTPASSWDLDFDANGAVRPAGWTWGTQSYKRFGCYATRDASVSFSLSDMGDYGRFQAIYDFYRLVGVKMTITYLPSDSTTASYVPASYTILANPSGSGTTNLNPTNSGTTMLCAPELHYAVDFDLTSSGTPLTLAQIFQYGNKKTHDFGKNRTCVIELVPKTAELVSAAGYIEGKAGQWLDLQSSTSTEHYGLQLSFDHFNPGCSQISGTTISSVYPGPLTNFRFDLEYVCEFKGKVA